MQSQFVQLKETEHLQCSVSHLFMESLQDKERSTKRQVMYTKGQERLLQAELCHLFIVINSHRANGLLYPKGAVVVKVCDEK